MDINTIKFTIELIIDIFALIGCITHLYKKLNFFKRFQLIEKTIIGLTTLWLLAYLLFIIQQFIDH